MGSVRGELSRGECPGLADDIDNVITKFTKASRCGSLAYWGTTGS